MFAQLEVIAGADQGRIFPLSPGEPLVIGRGRDTVTRLKDLHVSRTHCRIEFRGNDILLTDLNSIGGTIVNGQAIREHVLTSGDLIQLGETQLRFQSGEITDLNTLPPNNPGSHIPQALPIEAAPSRPDRPSKVSQRSGSGRLPAAVPIAEPLPADVPIPDALEVRPARPKKSAHKALPGERLGELSGSLFSHFQVGPVLAKGKSGMVFRAVNRKTRRGVALKILRPEFTRNEDEVRRFVRSMRTMLPLRHPNLVRLYGAGKKGPYCWIEMEYVNGESLTQVIRRIGVAGMLDWRHSFRLAVHLARALQYAHDRHIIHRNMTPQNVLIRLDDRLAKLGDLMLAKATEGSMAQEITRSNEVLGDMRYMSPEQTFGPEAMDNRSDIYSLGALLYAVLTGQPPFEADNLIDTIAKIRQAPVTMPKKYQFAIPDAFQSIVLRMMAKRPEDRYQTVDELLIELERVGKFQGVTV